MKPCVYVLSVLFISGCTSAVRFSPTDGYTEIHIPEPLSAESDRDWTRPVQKLEPVVSVYLIEKAGDYYQFPIWDKPYPSVVYIKPGKYNFFVGVCRDRTGFEWVSIESPMVHEVIVEAGGPYTIACSKEERVGIDLVRL